MRVCLRGGLRSSALVHSFVCSVAVCRCSAVFPPPWCVTWRSYSSTSPSPVWPSPIRPGPRRSCAGFGASWSSSLWISCPRRTSCPRLEPRRPWSPRSSGLKSYRTRDRATTSTSNTLVPVPGSRTSTRTETTSRIMTSTVTITFVL